MRYSRDPQLEDNVLRQIASYSYSPTVTQLSEALAVPRTRVYWALHHLEADGRLRRAGPQRRICVK